MKRVWILLGICFLAVNIYAQEDINYQEMIEALQHSTPNVLSTDDALTLKFLQKDWTVKKGDEVLIYLPAGGRANYMFIQNKKGVFNAKLLGQVADVVGSGAMAVGLGSNNLETLVGAMKVMDKANAVSYGVDALNKIDELNISKKAKRIAGKKAEVLEWKVVDDSYMVYVKIGKKKYEIDYVSAILTNEIKLLNSENKEE